MKLLLAPQAFATRASAAGAAPTRGLVVARLGWAALAMLIAGLFGMGIGTAAQRLDPGVVAIETVLALAYAGVAGLLMWRRSAEPMAVFAAFTLLTFGPVTFADVIPALGETHPVFGVLDFLLHVAGAACFTVFVFIFPDGRFVPSWTRWIALPWVVVQMPDLLMTEASGLRGPYFAFASAFFLIGIGCAVFAQVFRYRRVSTPVQRQQTKWTVFGFTLALGGYLGLGVLVLAFPSIADDALTNLVIRIGKTACMLLLPLSIGVAVLRHRLYDIDLLINRTIVYGGVTVILVVSYLGVSVLTQRMLEVITGDRSGVLPNSVGLAVALAFQPLRRRVKHLVDGVLPPREELALVFTDIVGSTEKAAAWGDSQWRLALERYRATVRRELKRFGGREVDTAGDGFFVAFSAPQAAVRCAQAIAVATRDLGLPSRLGVHYGGCEVRGEKLTGLNVHTAARVMSLAGADEVVVSEPVRDALTGGEVHFEDRGAHVLKGVPGEWRVYAVGA